MKAMILAAGLGQRMRPLTDTLPKPLIPAAGKPLLQYHFEQLAQAGVREVIINLAYLGEKIRAFAGDGSDFGLSIIYSEEPEPLETGGALLHALPLLGDEPFLLLNGDAWCDLPLSHLITHPLLSDQRGHLLLVENPDFHPRGDFVLGLDTYLLPGCELPESDVPHPGRAAVNRYTFAGISLLRPQLIRDYPHLRRKFPLGETLRYAIDHRQLTGEIYRGHWSDVGTPGRLQQLELYLAGRRSF